MERISSVVKLLKSVRTELNVINFTNTLQDFFICLTIRFVSRCKESTFSSFQIHTDIAYCIKKKKMHEYECLANARAVTFTSDTLWGQWYRSL